MDLAKKWKLIRGQKRNSGKSLLGPLLQQWGVRPSNRFPYLLTPRHGAPDSLCGARVGVHIEVRPERWHRWLPTALLVLSAGDMHSNLLLLPTPCFCLRPFRSGSGSFWVFLCLTAHNSPQLCVHIVIFSACSFFVFCCSRRCLSSCKRCS